jgi:hypothetical protein
MNDTPRTNDQSVRYYDDATGTRIEYVASRFARQIERELIGCENKRKAAVEMAALAENQRDRMAEALNMYAWTCSDEELAHYCTSACYSSSVEAQREMKRRKVIQTLITNEL